MKQTQEIPLTFVLGDELKVNRLGYGTMQLTGPGVWGEAKDRKLALSVLEAAVAAGVNFFDTADSYGPHTAEVLVHDALKKHYKDIVIATKGGFERSGPGQWHVNGKPEHIAKAIDGSLKRLGMEQIDLYQLHRVDPKVPIEESLRPIADAVKAGKIKYVGLSEADVKDIEQAEKVVKIVSVQNLYNLAERKWESLVDYTAQKGIAFIPWFPLASGPDKMKDKIGNIAVAKKATPAQVALAWLLKRSPNILLIPGTSSLAHLQENLAASQVVLTNEEFDLLSK